MNKPYSLTYNLVELKPSQQILVTASQRGRYIRARYAFVRAPYYREQGQDHALYDIVDNGEGSERVLARLVRYDAAMLIVGALNAVEEAERVRCTWSSPIENDPAA
jgi:hypothetical protein